MAKLNSDSLSGALRWINANNLSHLGSADNEIYTFLSVYGALRLI